MRPCNGAADPASQSRTQKDQVVRKLIVFNHVSLDGYFVDAKGDMSWAHRNEKDPEWEAFVEGNAIGGGTLLFGRVTYELMASFWPTPPALQMFPTVAKRMN